MSVVIAIDGPSASGKGTIASSIAKALGFDYLNTGALYRAVTLMALKCDTPFDDGYELGLLAKQINLINIADPALYSKEISQATSKISIFPEVRQALLSIQRDFPVGKIGVIVEGRDIGTVIFPNADIKFFLTASLESRAMRRYKQLQNTEANIIFNDVLQDLHERDLRDANRNNAPLKTESDYIIVDTTKLDQIEVHNLVLRFIRDKLGIMRSNNN